MLVHWTTSLKKKLNVVAPFFLSIILDIYKYSNPLIFNITGVEIFMF